MEILVGIAALGALAWAGNKAVATFRKRRRQSTADEAARQAIQSRRVTVAGRRNAERDRLNAVAAKLQIALLTLPRAPDFQRAAQWARLAEHVPAPFRQRVFVRFRPNLVHHMAARLSAGEDAERLFESLTALVQALGIAAFEAQYIVTEAKQQVTQSSRLSTRSFDQQLQSLQRAHEERLAAIRGLQGIDADTMEQLVETELARFREAILSLGNRSGTA